MDEARRARKARIANAERVIRNWYDHNENRWREHGRRMQALRAASVATPPAS